MEEKLLAEHRRRIGDFEVVEIDEHRVIALREQLDVDCPVDLHWTWDYARDVEDLRALYERGKKGQWNAQTDLDWSTPFPRHEWFMPKQGVQLMPSILQMMGADDDTCREAAWDEFAWTFSQLLHGEQAALQLCGQLTNTCPTMDQKFYAASQVIDEARHVEVLSKFMSEKIGTIHPIGGTLKVLLDKLLEAPTWKMKTLGMQCLFEGMAVGIFDLTFKASTNPLLTEMMRKVKQDEARHAAFGILCMRKVVKECSRDELQEMEDFSWNILETLNANQQLDMLRDLGPKFGLDPDNVITMMLQIPEWKQFNSEVYMHTIVPNLVRLGLITERSESKYRDVGILYGDRFGTGIDPDVAASMTVN